MELDAPLPADTLVDTASGVVVEEPVPDGDAVVGTVLTDGFGVPVHPASSKRSMEVRSPRTIKPKNEGLRNTSSSTSEAFRRVNRSAPRDQANRESEFGVYGLARVQQVLPLVLDDVDHHYEDVAPVASGGCR